VTDDEDPRAVLGRFLRARRERLSPGDLGFPDAGRRRTPGLRREEVAVAAGLSATWYTYLEQGRDRDVSPAVLNSLARVLQMTEDERRYMHFMAYGHAPRVEPPEENSSLERVTRSVVETTEAHPYPVFAVDRACGLIAWNRASVEWYGDWSRLSGNKCNFLLWLFNSEQAKERLVDWEAVARSVVARWRAELARGPEDPLTAGFVESLKNQFTLFDTWWNEIIVEDHHPTIRRFNHPRLGVRKLQVAPFLAAYEGAASAVLFHFPND
jgi:transcriptional regulator with XRE-family HTH domain